MCDLPTELMDLILENLHPDPWDKGLDVRYHEATHGKPHLRASSLVSRTWNAVARRHLFRNVVFSYKQAPPKDVSVEDADIRPPYGTWSSETPVRWKTFAMFCEFIRTNLNVQPHIVRLKLEAYQARYPSSPSGPFNQNDRVSLTLFLELIHSLPRLHTLLLYNVVIDARPPKTLSRPSLDHLCLSYCAEVGGQVNAYRTWSDRKQPETGMWILECFGKATTLHLLDCFGETYTVAGKEPPQCAIGFESLILEDLASTEKLARSLTANPGLSNLRKLTLDAKPAVDAKQLLSTVSPQLEELSYSVRFNAEYTSSIALKDFPNLRSLTLGLHFDEESVRFDDGVPVQQQLAAAYTLHGPVKTYLPHLKVITIHVDIEDSILQDESRRFSDATHWHSFQEALLDIRKQLSLPGIWIEYRSLNDFMVDEHARNIVGNLFAYLRDDGSILWRDKGDSQWPLLFVTTEVFSW